MVDIPDAIVSSSFPRQLSIVYAMGAQITPLKGNASVPHPLLLRNEAPLLAQW